MTETGKSSTNVFQNEEKILHPISGMPILIINILLMILSVLITIYGIITLEAGQDMVLGTVLTILGFFYLLVKGPILFLGLKVLQPNEALVLTLFGKYYGTLKKEGFFFVHPFVSSVNPAAQTVSLSSAIMAAAKENKPPTHVLNKKISLKAITLNNEKQKVNDRLGNPIIIGVVVIWRVVNTVKAVFNVDNYLEYLSIQCDSALRDMVRNYPYDTPNENSEMSLRGSSLEVADKLRINLQEKVELAGLEITEAKITHLSYAPEIAAVMLQRQQASAIVDARQMIVEGAVGTVEMALAKLNENDVVKLDEERKAAMVSNLLVVLCANRDIQPIINSGSLY